MLVKFSKMHGLGNDFVVVDAISQHVNFRPEQVKKLSDRHLGIGFDQLLLVEPPTRPDVDFRYRIYNASGSEVENCGNGARCFAQFVIDNKLTAKRQLRVQTSNGVLQLTVVRDGFINVDMGAPILEAARVPFIGATPDHANKVTITLDKNTHPELSRSNVDYLNVRSTDEKLLLTCSIISMGNPHAVFFASNLDTAEIAAVAKAVQAHPDFPEGVNVGFMEISDKRLAKLRVYERGVGETQACGTGACAAMVAGRLAGVFDDEVVIRLRGGNLNISWLGEDSSVIMEGPAVTVFEGKVRL